MSGKRTSSPSGSASDTARGERSAASSTTTSTSTSLPFPLCRNLNSDNFLLSGRTMDYGPFGWMERFDPGWCPWVGGGRAGAAAWGSLACFGVENEFDMHDPEALRLFRLPHLRRRSKVIEIVCSDDVVVALTVRYGLPPWRRAQSFDEPCVASSYDTASFLYMHEVQTWDCFQGLSRPIQPTCSRAVCSSRSQRGVFWEAEGTRDGRDRERAADA